MSYSFDDFFEEKLMPALKELLVERDPPPEESLANKFLSILGSKLHEVYRFNGIVLKAIINPYQMNLSTHDLLRKIFDYISDEAELRKIEYSEGDTIISVNYHGTEEE